MDDKAYVEMEKDLALPVFRLVDPERMKHPNYREGLHHAYFNPTEVPVCVHCTKYQQGILDGLALWYFALQMKNHDPAHFDALFPTSGVSEATTQVRRYIAKFWKTPSRRRGNVSLQSFSESEEEEQEQPHARFSKSLPFIMVGEARGFA